MKKIYIVIFLAAVVRLYHINFPILGWHSWRQSDTAAIARNFYYNGFNILYPQIDWNGNGTGYVESEFHLYPFIVSLLYAMFGVNDIFGRIVSIIFSLLTVYGIYLLVRKLINERVALWSSFIYAILPLNIFYGRAFMPESTLLMCSVFSIYFFGEWIDKEKTKYLVLTWFFLSLAILVKLPALYLGLPLLYLAVQKYSSKAFANHKLWLLAAFVLIPVVLWYYHAHQLYLESGATFGIWTFGQDKWGTYKQLLDPWFYIDLVFMDINERQLTYAGFVLFVIGIFVKRRSGLEKLFDYWIVAVLIYFLIASHAVRVHEYYQLPFVLPASVFIGKTLDKLLPEGSMKALFEKFNLSTYFAILCIILICILSFLRVSYLMKSERLDSPLFKITDDVKSMSNKSDLIITVSNGNPVYLYNCDRKGWTVNPDKLDSVFISKRIHEGAKYITGEKNEFEGQKSKDNLKKILSTYIVSKDDAEYFIVKLQ